MSLRGCPLLALSLALLSALLSASPRALPWAVAVCVGGAPAHAAPRPDAQEAQAVVTDAYLYAYPLLLLETARRVQTNTATPDAALGTGAPMNRFMHMSRLPDTLLHGVAYPDVDVLWSALWFDVSKEPLIIDMPDAHGRYYMMSIADMWSDVFAAPGSRTLDDGRQSFAIVASDWRGTLPKNVDLLRAPTSTGLLHLRIRVMGSTDLPAAQGFQEGFEATPLSRWGKKMPPIPGKFDVALSRIPPVEQVANMNAADFFSAFAELAGRFPPHANDTPILQRMRRLGLEPGHRFELTRAPAAVQEAFDKGVQAAQARVRSPAEPRVNGAGGLLMPQKRRGAYGTDYALRARSARAQWVAPLTEDAISVRTGIDADGRPLDGTFRYEVRFERGQLPPVNAFWSLTLYNDRAMLLDNPVNRFAVGTRDALTMAADGTTTAYIQYSSPVADRVRNWLPSPQSGRFSLELRLYWPRDAAVDGAWTPPAIRRIQ